MLESRAVPLARMTTGLVGMVALAGIAVSGLEHIGVAVSPLQDFEPALGYIVDAARCYGRDSDLVHMPGLVAAIVAADTAAAARIAVVAEKVLSVTAGAGSPGFCKNGWLDLPVELENMGEVAEVAEGIARLLNVHRIAMSEGMSSTAEAGCILVATLFPLVGHFEVDLQVLNSGFELALGVVPFG